MRFYTHDVGTQITDFLASYDPGTRGPADMAALAAALGSGKTDTRKAAKKKLEASKHSPLVQALKALPRRAYSKGSGKKLVEQLDADFETLASLELDVSEFALNVVCFLPRFAKPLVAERIDARSVDGDIIDTWINRERAELHAQLPANGPVLLERVLAAGLEWKALSLWVKEAQPLGDWSEVTTTSLSLDGPITAIEALPSNLRELELLGTQLQNVPESETLESLRITAGGGIGARTLEGDLPLSSLPSASRLPKLSKLSVRGAAHLHQLPEDIGAMSELRELELVQCGLHTLPVALGELSLSLFTLERIAFESLPSIEGTPPQTARVSEVTCAGPVPDPTKAFLHWPSTGTALASLSVVDRLASKIPALRTEVDAARLGTSSNGPELLVAITRTFIDIEHGPSANDFWKMELEKLGGAVEQAVSAVLPARLTTPEAASDAFASLAIEGFDADECARLVTLILQSDHHRSHRADWE